ncbi:MAG: F0F1 ATP synthase subunit B' [Proteobacteria bacterium]|nr:F0F1 ATP synthase subunit B' [Pseudomonadota bacterium]
MAETTSAHTQAPGGPPPKEFPPFQRETFASQLIWLALTFGILYVLVARIGLPRVGGILQARGARIAGDIADAERLRDQSQAALAAYEKALAEARNRAHAVAGEARARADAQAEATRKTLEDKLNARLAEAERSIAATKTAAMSNVRGIAIEAAGAIVTRLIGDAPGEKAAAAAVDDALRQTHGS